MKRVLLISVLIALAYLSGCREEEVAEESSNPRPVLAVQVGKTDYLGQRSFPGRAQASREVSLAFRVSGTMSQRMVRVGDHVEAGDVVAILDSEPFQADVSRLEADLAAAKADFLAKEEQYARVQKLVESGTYSEARGDLSLAERDTAAARASSVASALERARLDLADTVLKVPYAGRIVAVYAENFEEISARKPIARLLDASSLEIVIDMPETLIALVPMVEEMSVQFDAFPDVELAGVISEVGSEASQRTRTYPVTILMQQTEGATILPGMSGQARASKVKNPDVATGLVIPATSLRPMSAGGDQMAVWVIDDNTKTVALRPVEIGQLLSIGVEVTSGLSEGDWVVTAGTHSLKEEQEVRILDTASGASQ